MRFANIIRLGDLKSDVVFRDIKSRDCRLFYILSGGGILKTEDTDSRLTSGTLCILQPGTRYMWRPDPLCPTEAIIINFDYTQDYSTHVKSYHPEAADSYSEDEGHARIIFYDADCLNSPLLLSDMHECEAVLRTMVRERFLKRPHSEQLLSHLLSQVILCAVRACEEKPAANEKKQDETALKIRGILEYIQQNYGDPSLDNEKIAAHFGYHPNYLGRLVKKYTGQPLHKFVVLCRINAARELLANSTLNIGETARAVGFVDIPNFTRVFRQYTGVLPSEYGASCEGASVQLGVRLGGIGGIEQQSCCDKCGGCK